MEPSLLRIKPECFPVERFPVRSRLRPKRQRQLCNKRLASRWATDYLPHLESRQRPNLPHQSACKERLWSFRILTNIGSEHRITSWPDLNLFCLDWM